ncbi:uncharacterized protein [Phyllobates terribilis]|uniref:uncharacterized protein n=1 Tax=Phyllobates terribilis TaxID=111132 RepID=UPI003CCAC971
MEFVRNMERRRLIKPQDILATLQSIPEDESESELQEHVFDSDSDEDFIPQNISSESEDSEGTNPEDIPSTSTGDRAHAVMLPRDHPPGRGQKKSAKRPRNERTTDNDGGEGNATTNTREGESEGILVSADGKAIENPSMDVRRLHEEFHMLATTGSEAREAFNEMTDKWIRDQIVSWWEVQSLDNYIKSGIVPHHLRIALSPGYHYKNPNLLIKWEKEATESSLRLMKLLVEESEFTQFERIS